MKHRLSIALCSILGIICCATVIVWARSYVSSEALMLSRPLGRISVVGSEGRVVLMHGRLRFASPAAWEAWRSAVNPNIDVYAWSFSVLSEVSPVPETDRNFAGFGLSQMEAETRRGRQIPGVTWRRTMIEFPFWAAVVLTGAWPGLRLWKSSRQRGQRIARGLCRRCGFDLAGVYYSCPQCGERLPLPAFEVIIKAK